MKKSFLSFGTFLIFCVLTATAGAQQTQNYDPGKVFDPTFLNAPGTLYRSGNGTPGPKYWTNHINYTIHTALHPQDTTVTGKVEIEYINNSPDSLHYLWLQVDQNLFDPNSIGHAMMPPGGNRFARPGHAEFCCGGTVSNVSVTLDGKTYHPDYVISDTRMQIRLRQPVTPDGGKVSLSMEFKFKVPRYGSDRMGRVKTKNGWVYEIAQWYPRMEVYDDIRGWAHLPYVGLGEFYEDYGNYNYYVTVPWNMIVAGSGKLQNPKKVLTSQGLKRYKKAQQSDSTVYIIKPNEAGHKNTRPVNHGTLTWHFKMKNSRDVAWAASKAFIWDGAKVNLPNGKKALAMSVYPVESTGTHAWQHSTNMLKRSMEIFSKITGFTYPWTQATNVAGVAGGMEYPGIIFCSYSTGNALALWNVTVHEIGHDWFPMIVGSNERRNMWMDEGFNTYIDGIASQIYKNGKFRYFGWDNPRALVRSIKNNPNPQPLITRPDAMGMNSYGLYYTKTSLGLNILRNVVVGKKLFDYAFKSYVQNWAYKHPRPVDFFNRMNDATGMDLNWFWKEWFYTNWTLDQAITDVKTDSSGSTLITIQNKNQMVMPVKIRLWEADGQTSTKKLPVQIWQRTGTWTFKVNVNSPVVKAELDPDMQLPDIDRTNNVWETGSHTLKPAPKGETAQKVINHYIQAVGGKKTLQDVNDITYQISTQSEGYKINITEMKKRPDKFSLVVQVPAIGQTVESIKVNGNEVHLKTRGKESSLTDLQKAHFKQNTIIFPELKYLSGDYQLTLAGVTSDNGRKVYVVDVTGPAGVKKIIHYDVNNGLKTKMTINNGNRSQTVLYSDYRPVDGIMIAYKRVSNRGGAKTAQKVQSVKVNNGLKSSDFE